MAYKYEDVFELMRSTASSVVETQDNWKAFLSCAAMNYKRPFYNQLLIYRQRPDATACATFDYWNEKMGRFVKKGSKGIVTLDLKTQNKEVLFDVSDTGSRSNSAVPIWAVSEEMYFPLALALQEHFETEVSSGDLAAVLLAIGEHAATLVSGTVAEDICARRQDSPLSNLEEVELTQVVQETLIASVQYMLLKRCGLVPEEQIKSFDFPYIGLFTSNETLSELGSAINSITNALFKDISLSVRSIEKILSLNENSIKEVEKNVSDLHETRGLSDTEHLSAEAGDEFREVRDVEKNLSDEREDGGIYGTDTERYAEPSSERDRQVGDGERDRNGAADGAPGGRDGRIEDGRPDEVGGADEQFPSVSAGDHSERDDLRIDDEPWAPEDTKHPELPFEYVLTNVLQHHRWLRVTGPEIQNYFLENSDEDARIAFLQEMYNKDYTQCH